jgi:lysophospholipid acyltransferase (LPLAT)-like uncharacterized protein
MLPKASQTDPHPPKPSIVVPHQLPWNKKIVASAGCIFFRALMATWRLRTETDFKKIETVNRPVIYCLWHNRLALSMKMYDFFGKAHWPAPGMAALISASRDGAFLAYILKKFQIEPVRGSSSRRGQQALLEATTWLEKKFHVAITPDGPRGPRYKIQEGVIALAQLSGAPILPVSAFVRSKFCLRSWDGFQIPLPFARCEIRVGQLLYVPRETSEAERERLRQQLEGAMHAITTD